MLFNPSGIRRVMVFCLVIALTASGILTTAPASAAGNSKGAGTKNNPQIVGQLSVQGSVTLNEKKAINGTSVFDNSLIRVACAKGNSAIVNLGRLGRLDLSPGTSMVLRFSEGLISGDLLEGNATVNAPPGIKVSINTPEGVIAADGKDNTVLPVKTQRGVRCVPMVISSSSSSPALGTGAIAAILIGVGGAAVAGAAVAGQNTNPASGVVP